ncbi:MAG: SpaH/EbpB family LPXTG-anchored major pilin [Clostridia bacterium]|nr:SpaH/EbpB family LPXTG-anchored major pilin [Clostridia bacterium]
MKRFFTLMLAVMMIMTLAAPAFAGNDGTTIAATEPGSITINGVSEENIYSIYKIMDLESYNTASGAYSYKTNDVWAGFFATPQALTYVAVDSAGYITWIAAKDDDTVAAFAKIALAYAKDNDIAPVKSSANAGEFVITTDPETNKTSGKFSGLELGYYLIDSTMGALCGLTTTNPDASINAKNGAPTIDKQVQEDSTEQWGDKNTADIGQIVNFRVTINVHAGAENYVLHDTMSEGLTFIGVEKIEHIVPGVDTHTVGTDLYEVLINPDLKEADPDKYENFDTYTECSYEDDEGNSCTFEIHFDQELCDELETNDKVVITYQAMLNRDALIAAENNNSARLEFGEGYTTTEDETETFTFGFDIVKTDSQNTLIDGAEFKIYDAATGGNEVTVVLMSDGVTYRRARSDEEGVSIVVTGGNVRVVGFDNGTYYLEETAAPAGYNKLTARQKFIISDGNLDATFNGEIYSTGSGVHVVNKTGSMLPETGGLGTALFIAFGGIVTLGAGVVLFAKKRLAQYEE